MSGDNYCRLDGKICSKFLIRIAHETPTASNPLLLDLSEDLRVLEEEVFLEWVEHLRNSIIGYKRGDPTYLLAHFDGIASPARQQYTVTSFDSGGDDLAVFVGRSWAYGNDGSFR